MNKSYTFVFDLGTILPRMTLLDAYVAPSTNMAVDYATRTYLSLLRAGCRFESCDVFETGESGKHICTITAAPRETKIEYYDKKIYMRT